MDELSVDVGNGRALGYREYGAPDGRPVVNCHGGLEVRAGEGHFLGYLHQADILREFTI